MAQKEVVGKSLGASEVFIELHIEDLVKDRLLWQERVDKRAYQSDALPSVIHLGGSSLITLR